VKPAKLIERYRVDDADRFQLATFDPADSGGLDLDKDKCSTTLAQDIDRLAKLQERLYAHDRWALLVVLQGMDASARHQARDERPQSAGVRGAPVQAAEGARARSRFPLACSRTPSKRGQIGIFNRSHYEEVLAVRVRPDLLARQKLPDVLVTKDIWKERFKDIRDFERHLARNGVAILKFFLHISPEEQRPLLLARLDEPAKRWKFSMGDIADRKLWGRYMDAYEDMISATSRPEAPRHAVPSDHKWFARLVVAGAMIEALEGLNLEYPKIEGAALEELQRVRKALLSEEHS
jgi:PPK2 family polyphosphate:nucleotide phosphotransferase